LLAVIGRTWLDCKNDDGERRLCATEDWVREEIEIGLEIWIHVIPVLVVGAQMPKDEELPDSIRKLADQNWVEIGDGPNFHRDMDRLIKKLQELPSQIPSRLNREDVQNIIGSARRQGKRPDLRNRNLVGIDLDGEDLSKVDFTKANLSFARLEQANLENTVLQGANLYNANLYRAHMKGANLRRAKLKETKLIKPTLTDADLSEVDLKETNVDFDDANLEYAKLFETDLSNLDLKKAILIGAEYSSKTIWSDGFDPEKAGAILIK
jgi:Pentapeptide repeats (8 copies)